MNLTPATCTEVVSPVVTFEPASERTGKFSPTVCIQSIGAKEAFEEVRFASHVLSNGLLFISRHPGYKVGHFVDVAFLNRLAGETNEPKQRAEIIHILTTNRGDLAIGLRYRRDS